MANASLCGVNLDILLSYFLEEPVIVMSSHRHHFNYNATLELLEHYLEHQTNTTTKHLCD